jgi:hypothetical protein
MTRSDKTIFEAAVDQVMKVSLAMTPLEKEAQRLWLLNATAQEKEGVWVFRSIRDDVLGEMYGNRLIDHVQFMAGREWQSRYERSWPKADDEIRRIGAVLGKLGDSVLHDVLADGLSIAHGRDRLAKSKWEAIFLKYLDFLAIEFALPNAIAA